MTTCTLLSDRIPDVVAGRSSWRAEEDVHLAACAECRAEWDLVSTAAGLAEGYRAPDPSATAAAVVERLRADASRHAGRRGRWVSAGLAAAAVVAVVVWGGLGRRNPVRPASPPGLAAAPGAPTGAAGGFPLPELDSLPPEALDSILRVLDEPLARADAWELPDFGDIGDQVLERAITGREG